MKAGPALEGVGVNAKESLAAACALVASSPVPLGRGAEFTAGASAEISVGTDQQPCPADLPRLVVETPTFGPIARAYYEASYHNMQRGGPDIRQMSLQPIGSAEVAVAGDPAGGERDRRGSVPSIRSEGLIPSRRENEQWQELPQPVPSLSHDCFCAPHGQADREEEEEDEDGSTDDLSRTLAAALVAAAPAAHATTVSIPGTSGAFRPGAPDGMVTRGSFPSRANGGVHSKKTSRNGCATEADAGAGSAAIVPQKPQELCATALSPPPIPQSARPAMQQASSGRNGGTGGGSSARTRSASMRRTTSSGSSSMRGSLTGVKRGFGSSGIAIANMQQQQQQRAQPPTPRGAAALTQQASSTCRSPKTARSDSATAGARNGGQRLAVQGPGAAVRTQVSEDDVNAPSAADATATAATGSSGLARAAVENPERGGSPRRADSAARSAQQLPASPQPRIAGLMSELGSLRDQVVDCRAEYELVRDQAAQLETENATLKQKLCEAERHSARLLQLEEENESLRRQLCETERCAAELRQRNHEVEADRDTWRGRWDQTHMKLEESWKQYDALQARWEETEEKVDAARRKREQDRKRLRQAEKLLQELGRCDSPASARQPCNANAVSPGGSQASPVFGGTRG